MIFSIMITTLLSLLVLIILSCLSVGSDEDDYMLGDSQYDDK